MSDPSRENDRSEAMAAREGALRAEFARPLPWTLLLLAAPMIAGMISRTAMGLVDFIMVSQLGTEPQAAIVPAGITLFTLIAFGIGVMTAVNTLVAQHDGRDEKPICAQYTWQGVWLSGGIGIAALAMWPTVPWLFAWAGHEAEVASLETVYVQIGLLGVGPIVASVAVGNFFGGIHRPVVTLWATLISNAFNLVANYALIFGGFGFPALGMAGAAWATVLASAVNLAVLLAWWLRPSLGRAYAVWDGWRFSARQTKRLLKLGLPAGVHFAADLGTFTVFTLWLIGRFGTTELAANNIALKFWEVAIIPCAGMGQAVSAAVGRAIGQQRLDRARRFAHWGNGISVGYVLVTGLVFLAVGAWLIAQLTDDPAVARRAWQLLCVAVVALLFDCAQIVYSSALRGAGDTLFPAITAPIAAVGIMLAGGYAASVWWPQGGAVGPWLALAVYLVALAGLWFVRFQRGRWETMDATGSAPAAPIETRPPTAKTQSPNTSDIA